MKRALFLFGVVAVCLVVIAPPGAQVERIAFALGVLAFAGRLAIR